MSLSGTIRDKAMISFGSEIDVAVIKATSQEPTVPKQKHVETLKTVVRSRQIGMQEVFNPLRERLRDSSWQVVLKSLEVIHELIREPHNQALRYLAANSHVLNSSSIRSRISPDGLSKIHLIEAYASYLEERVLSYAELQFDFVLKSMEKEGRLRARTDLPGLMKDIQVIQRVVNSLLAIKFKDDTMDHPVTLHALQLVLKDLLKLYHAMNEGVINILECYFDMKFHDAQKSLEIYKSFVVQTQAVTAFLENAKQFQVLLTVDIPTLKIPPSSLVDSLNSYLMGLDQGAQSQPSTSTHSSTQADPWGNTSSSWQAFAQPQKQPPKDDLPPVVPLELALNGTIQPKSFGLEAPPRAQFMQPPPSQSSGRRQTRYNPSMEQQQATPSHAPVSPQHQTHLIDLLSLDNPEPAPVQPPTTNAPGNFNYNEYSGFPPSQSSAGFPPPTNQPFPPSHSYQPPQAHQQFLSQQPNYYAPSTASPPPFGHFQPNSPTNPFATPRLLQSQPYHPQPVPGQTFPPQHQQPDPFGSIMTVQSGENPFAPKQSMSSSSNPFF